MKNNRSVWLWCVLLTLTAAATALTGCGAGQEQRDELGVTRVVLYQNGVGYFERQGNVDGDTLRLRVRPEAASCVECASDSGS